MSAWRPASPAAIEPSTSMPEGLAPIEPRTMFGHPGVSVAGHLAIGTHEAGIVMRLPEYARAWFIAEFSATNFTPRPGQVVREGLVVPPAPYGEHAMLAAWAARSVAHVAALQLDVPAVPKAQKTPKESAPAGA